LKTKLKIQIQNETKLHNQIEMKRNWKRDSLGRCGGEEEQSRSSSAFARTWKRSHRSLFSVPLSLFSKSDGDAEALPVHGDFLGDVFSDLLWGRRKGPILGARELAAPTSPLVTLTKTSTTWEGSNFGGMAFGGGLGS
jgi:hypothetical protein